MKTLIDLITEQVTNAFTGQGYDAKYGKVTLSNRPDLCEYQCNGAMAAAKEYKCAPFMISDKIAQALAENELFESVESVKPGFINMKVSPAYLAKYVSDMKADEGRFGCDKAARPKTIIVDYGGANVAKPLHVGHLRSAVIGESIKRIGKFMGHHMIGDVHLGDWGLQMGLIIVELKSVSRIWYIMMKAIPENIRKRRRLPFPNWRISIRLPAKRVRKTKRSVRLPWRQPASCRPADGDTVHFLHTFWMFP